jgi:2-hydroxychromene-2-carboxylate isomerase
MTAPTVEFWFEFASRYSHVAAQRIEAAARAAGVPLVWRPFLIGSELYWGNERLEDALAYCAGLRSS